jgi:hypothetical protein
VADHKRLYGEDVFEISAVGIALLLVGGRAVPAV